MKRWLCVLLCASLLMAQIALAEAPPMSVDELTRQFLEDNLEDVDDAESYRQIGREMSEALGRGEDGLLKPGTRLLRLLTAPQGDELTGNHFEMPTGDWDKLAFMFAQGLLQYELRGSLHMEPDDPIDGALDGTIEMDAGYDSDGCLSMDGSVLGTLIEADGSVEIQGDDMFVRYNQRTGEQRLKMPFLDELTEEQRAQVTGSGELLGRQLRTDAPHWADALDILYETLRNQPELLPVFQYWFEGGEDPGDVSLTTAQLYRILGSALNDLSANERFADALSQTALLEALYKDGALPFDPAQMSAMQRKFALMGIVTVAASELNRQDKTEWPSGELGVRGGTAWLNMVFGQDSYGDFDAKLDAVLNRNDGGAHLRATLIDESGYATGARGTHTARVDCAEGGHTLLYNFVDSYGDNGRHLWLDAGKDGLQIEYSADGDDDPCGSLSVRKLDDTGGYAVQGQLGTRSQVYYKLDGGGRVEGGVASGEIALDYFRYEDSEPATVLSASYAVGGGQIQISGRFDNGELVQRPTVLSVELSGVKTEDKFDLRLSYGYAGDSGPFADQRGHQFRIDGAKRRDKWTGGIHLAPVVGTTAQRDIVGGDYALTMLQGGGVLNADLTIVNESARIPVHISASKGERSLSLLLSAMENYKFELGANLNPDNLLLHFGGTVGELMLSGLTLSSHSDGELRKSALEVVQNGESVQRVELDSRVRPIEDGYAFEHRLSMLPPQEGFVSASVDGEATMVQNMQSGDPLVMRQAASFDIEVEGGGVTGEFELNHRLHVDELKHREPKQPQRIEEWIAPEPSPEPEIEEEPEEEPVEDEEEYGYPVEPVEDAPAAPRATAKPRNTPSPLVPEETEEPRYDEPADDPIDGYDDIYDTANYDYAIEGGSARITAYRGDNVELYVPLEFDGKPVVAIGESAFADDGLIQSVLMPESLVAIGGAAFKGCTSLAWVYVPSGCTDIADDAFSGCETTLVLVGISGSAAQAFAEARGITFAPIDEPEGPETEQEIEQEIWQAEAEASSEAGADAPEAPAPTHDVDEPLTIVPEIIDG